MNDKEDLFPAEATHEQGELHPSLGLVAGVILLAASLVFSWFKMDATSSVLAVCSILLLTLSAFCNPKFPKVKRSSKHKIIGWALYDRNEKQWEDAHPGATDEDWADIEQTIVDEIRRKKYKFGGNYHQYGATGCPVMEDGTVVMVSMRHWGDIMSRVWGGNYCDYAWTHDQGEGYKVPKVVEGFANKIKWMTDEEVAERDRKYEEARKQAEVERQKHQKEIEKNEIKERKANIAFGTKFAAKFFKDRGLKVNVDVCNAVAELLHKAYTGAKESNCPSLKWIFDPAEQKRVENARKRQLKEAWETFNRVLDEHNAEVPNEDKKEDK